MNSDSTVTADARGRVEFGKRMRGRTYMVTVKTDGSIVLTPTTPSTVKHKPAQVIPAFKEKS